MTDTIQNNVNKLRVKLNITQEELAYSLAVSRQTVIAIEKGNYVPSLLLAIRIARYFKKPVESIFSICKK